ncbi:MAG: peroxiredoxin [Planctomycetaceae bacterium]
MRLLSNLVVAFTLMNVNMHDSHGSEPPSITLNVGDKAPVFESRDDSGETWKSADHIGKKFVVVYFYPADLTGGCTKQACGFRDHQKTLQQEGVEVVGVSGDSVENHKVFKKVHNLNFALLADEDGSVARAFGVPLRDGATIKKPVDGIEISLTRGVTASRWTFVIGLDGTIIHKNTAVDAAADSQAVVDIIKNQKSSS